MQRKRGELSCPQCSAAFEYMLVHAGLNECAYAYCDACGTAALLHVRGDQTPPPVHLAPHQRIDPGIEPHLQACACGGRFCAAAGPRCPSCHARLSAESLATAIEEDMPAARDGWEWQRDWDGLYCFIVNGRWVEDNWS